jgi:carboxymethylenebutenolidase
MIEKEIDAPTSSRDFNRRDFVRSVVGTGFAAAVLPVSAQTITTPADGLDAGPVSIPSGDFAMPAYRAAPKGKSGAPVVLVLPEIFGVHEHIADVARRFARRGYFAIAPDLMARQGDARSYSDVGRLMSEVVSKVPDAQVMSDLDAAVAWAQQQGADTTRLAATGFCWGGRMTWLYAAHSERLRAGVAWYGRLVGTASPQTPRHPVDLVGELKAPVLGLYGGKDQGIPLDSVDKMKAALKNGSAAARRSEFVVYPDAPHAFHADYRPSYVKADAEDGWKRCLDWIQRHLEG